MFNDIKNQNLHFYFKIVINNILDIFHNAFPKCFIDAVNSIEYADGETEIL